MMKRRPASRENSIIIGTILASGIVFVFGFFLGRAWVMIPQEQVDGYQKKSGAPVVLTEEKSETMILSEKKSHKEKPIGSVKPQKQQELAQKPAILPKKQQMIVQKQSTEHGTQNTERKQALPQVAQKPPVSQQKQQELAQKLAVVLQKQKQEAAAQKLAMLQATQKPIIPPQKQQMMAQKQSTERKQVIPQPHEARKPAVSPQKQPVVTQKTTVPQATQKPIAVTPQKQQMVVQKQVTPQAAQKSAVSPQKQPVVTQKTTVPQVTQKPIAVEPPQKQPEATQNQASSPQKQPQQNPAPQKTEGRFALQLGSFSDEAKASALVNSLSAKGCSAYKLKMEMGEKGTWYRVYVSGVFSSRIDAQQKGDSLKSQGVIGNYFVISSK
ncbi:SPOR domain-containing protein [Candidatus Desantisbacteria bacterium]|nr:SPOR domain-containing protein [Candidatus Desantisbacteria bacterium]